MLGTTQRWTKPCWWLTAPITRFALLLTLVTCAVFAWVAQDRRGCGLLETTTQSHNSTTSQTLPSTASSLFDPQDGDDRDLCGHPGHINPWSSSWSFWSPIRVQRVDGSGRVTSWGKSWEMAGDGSPHQPSILSPDFIPLCQIQDNKPPFTQVSHFPQISPLVKDTLQVSFNDPDNQGPLDGNENKTFHNDTNQALVRVDSSAMSEKISFTVTFPTTAQTLPPKQQKLY